MFCCSFLSVGYTLESQMSLLGRLWDSLAWEQPPCVHSGLCLHLLFCGENSTGLWGCISHQELGFLVLHWFWEHGNGTSTFSVWELGTHPAEIRGSKMGLASSCLQQLPVSLNKENNQI